jgi:ketosteroid isomerase-like protein
MATSDTDVVAAMQRVLIEQACQGVVLRTAACIDRGDAEALAALFSDDAVLVRPGAEPLTGRASIRDSYAQRPPQRMTRHLVTNMLVDVESPEQARVRSTVLLWTGSTGDPESPHGRPAHRREMVGEFDDRLRRLGIGPWLIARRDARFVLYRNP